MIKCPECRYKLSDATYGRFTCKQCKTEVIRTIEDKRSRVFKPIKVKTLSPLPSVKGTLKPLVKLCVGCWQPITTAFANHGTLIKSKAGGFYKTTEEWSYDPLTDKIEKTLKDVFIPLPTKVRGYICDSCLTTKTIEHKRKDGSVWHEPICKLDPLPSVNQVMTGEFIPTPKPERVPKRDPAFSIVPVLTYTPEKRIRKRHHRRR